MQVPRIDHEWYVLAFVAAGLARVALKELAGLIDDAKRIYIKLRDFRKPNDIPKLYKSPP
jgi:hypothetical protein